MNRSKYKAKPCQIGGEKYRSQLDERGGVLFEFGAKGARPPETKHPAWHRFLCRAGLHIFWGYVLTRFNPALNMSAYHCHCACGLCRPRLVWHKTE